jgi:hypothetical protein
MQLRKPAHSQPSFKFGKAKFCPALLVTVRIQWNWTKLGFHAVFPVAASFTLNKTKMRDLKVILI